MARRCLGLLVLGLLLGGCGGSDSSVTSSTFNAQRAYRDLVSQVRFGPRPAGSTANLVQARFIAKRLRQAGVREVRIQRPHANVVGRIPGTEPGVVVVGAHHDTKDIPGFVGANDGASGVAVVLELARELPKPLNGPSIEFALFDAEEARGDRPFARNGDHGSTQFVRYAYRYGTDWRQGSPRRRDIRAMVLFDMVGDCDLAVPREANSDATLYEQFAQAGESEDGSQNPFTGDAGPVLDDHTPFQRAGIPSVDLIDFDYGPGPTPGGWWHTRQDTLRHVCARSLGLVGEPALAALPGIR
jgi:glutaminyl-peptide cyclotransferase